MVAAALCGADTKACDDDCKGFEKDSRRMEDDMFGLVVTLCDDVSAPALGVVIVRGTGEAILVLGGFGVESTKVVSRNCPNDDVPPAITLACPPAMEAIFAINPALLLSSFRVCILNDARPHATLWLCRIRLT
jgi:hypothetical protein